MANILLGVTGSISAYRAADLARELMRAGHTVRACLTRSAAQFVTPVLFESLTGQPCLVDAFEEPDRGRMAHIEWARWADLVCIAPATAHFLDVLAQGRAEDMISTLCLATHSPLVVAPAMNPAMWTSLPVAESLGLLKARAAWVVEPATGEVACGEEGQGKLAPVSEIAAAVQAVLKASRTLAGRTLLVTTGPTQEPIDDVRYLTNRSSGKMGAALARAGLLMGATVRVVAGPQAAPLPMQASTIRTRTALEMLDASLEASEGADVIVAAAAVADYRPAERTAGKLRRSAGPIELRLVPNPDIVAALAKARPNAFTVAFAAEPDSGLEAARAKMAAKGVQAVAANDISGQGTGFESDTNRLQVLFADGTTAESGLEPKLVCALWLLDQVSKKLSIR